MKLIAPLSLALIVVTFAPEAFAQPVVLNTIQFTETEPVYQLPVSFSVTRATPPITLGCSIISGTCQPVYYEFIVSTLGLVFDAARRYRLPAGGTFDPQQHYQKITSTVTTSPGQFLTTTIIRLQNTLDGGLHTQLDITCQQVSTWFGAFQSQGVSITYSVPGLTSVTHSLAGQGCVP